MTQKYRSPDLELETIGAAVGPQPLPTPSVSFEGISVFDTVDLEQGYLPPDTTGEIGPDHFVQAVNVAFRVFSREGVPLTPLVDLGDLFSNVPAGCGGQDGFPQVIYDQFADRWLIAQRCSEGRRRGMLVAVSRTPDPTEDFYLYFFRTFSTKILDSPKFGVWPDGYYMTAQQFKKIGFFFRGAGFFAFEREKMLRGDPTASFVYLDSCPLNTDCIVNGALPFDADGLVPPPTGTPGMFTLYTADEYEDPQGDGIRIWEYDVDFANPENTTFTERGESPINVDAFSPNTGYVRQPSVPSAAWLQSMSHRFMYRAAYRNLGDGRETLILNHTVNVHPGDYTGIRYYELQTPGSGLPFTVVEQQTFSPDNTWRWMGSGAMNYLGDTAIGYSVSSIEVYPSIRYAARLATDPPGTGLAHGEQSIIEGGGSQYSEFNRWGTYSHMSVDPLDDCSFWFTTEYYENSNINGWQTRIAKFAPRECTVSPRGTINGTVTNCETGAPVQDVTISTSGVYSRRTGTDGTYAIAAIPGIYDVSAQKLGHVGQVASDVNLPMGGIVTRDFCVVPIPALEASPPFVTVGNNFVEPNECNTIEIELTNEGFADAVNVSAEISTTTPGVVIESATSDYPDLVANGGKGKNLTLLKIRTDETAVCFTDIDLKMTVHFDGAGAPAELNVPLRIGRSAGMNYFFTASGGHTLEPGGVLLPGSVDGVGGAEEVPAPFDFTLYGRQVKAGDPLEIIKYGVVEVGGTDPTPFPQNSLLPTTQYESEIGVVYVFWDDLNVGDTGVNGDGVFVNLFGAAPNRTFQIEWRGRNDPMHSSGDVDVFVGVQFHENSDEFDLIYQQTGSGGGWNGAGATIGVQGYPYGPEYTTFSYNSHAVTAGTKLSAKRSPPVCEMGNGQCGGLDTTHTRFDFDGDGRTDASIFRPGAASVTGTASPEGSNSQWWYLRSGDLGTRGFTFGSDDDILIPADFTGDGATDLAFYRIYGAWWPGYWFVLRSEDDTFFSFQFGSNGDIPVPGDYDGDGKSDPAVFRPSIATWFIFRSSDSQVMSIPFGIPEDKPVVADYDGDGKDDIAVYRPSVFQWWQLRSSEGVKAYEFGVRNDRTAVGDWTGDGRADIALFRPSTGFWFVIRSEDDSFYSFPWGADGDIPTPGDYDGDGRYDPAIWRPSESVWYILGSTGGFNAFQFGSPGDLPLPSTASVQ